MAGDFFPHPLLIALVVLAVILCTLAVFYKFYFLRKPRRRIPKGNTIASPASGKVVNIVPIHKDNDKRSDARSLGVSKGLLGRFRILVSDIVGKGKEGYLIVIMMTPMDVHFQRSPIEGTIKDIKYRKGKLLNAVVGACRLQASLENERNEIIIDKKGFGKIKVVQVAGFLARRIRCFVRPGQKIHKGEELGVICLGSQVLLVLPKKKGMRIAVKVGQKVTDGQTVIARLD